MAIGKGLKRDIKCYGIKYAIMFELRKLGLVSRDKCEELKLNIIKTATDEQKEIILKELFLVNRGYVPDVKNPKTFDEKINWIKLHGVTNKMVRMTDKYLVRNEVKKILGEDTDILIPLIGVWDRPEDIDYDSLPDSFVLKTNNACGTNIIVKDKSTFDSKQATNQLLAWLKRPFGYGTLQMQYLMIPPKIIAEEYIEQIDGNLYDYKIHCFHGKPMFIQVIGNRDLKKHIAYEACYDLEWNLLSFTDGVYPKYERNIDRPSKLKEMIEIAEKLSKGFTYVRVDLYQIEDAVKFGELTFTPASGYHNNFTPPETDLLWGEYMGDLK